VAASTIAAEAATEVAARRPTSEAACGALPRPRPRPLRAGGRLGHALFDDTGVVDLVDLCASALATASANIPG